MAKFYILISISDICRPENISLVASFAEITVGAALGSKADKLLIRLFPVHCS